MSNPFNRYNLGLFNSGTYTPFVCDISAITQDTSATITTAIDHGFILNNQVQFQIPPQWGMRQLNGLKGYVTNIPSTTEITVNINTTNFDSFVVPVTPTYVVIDPAQVSGIGDYNFGNLSPGGIPVNPIAIPGAYENQPPS